MNQRNIYLTHFINQSSQRNFFFYHNKYITFIMSIQTSTNTVKAENKDIYYFFNQFTELLLFHFLLKLYDYQ